MPHIDNFSYRSLELLCRHQAAVACTPETRRELEIMAVEYQRLADSQDRQPLGGLTKAQ